MPYLYCHACRHDKPAGEFAADPKRPSGIATRCASCAEHRKQKDREKKRRQNAAKRAREQAARPPQDPSKWLDPEFVKAYHRKYWLEKRKDKDPDSRREVKRAWRQANPDKTRIYRRTNDYRRAKACPPWADTRAITKIYLKRKELSEALGVELTVDHIVPISHPLVCGLHVEANLQLLDKDLNREKSNLVWPDMP